MLGMMIWAMFSCQTETHPHFFLRQRFLEGAGRRGTHCMLLFCFFEVAASTKSKLDFYPFQRSFLRSAFPGPKPLDIRNHHFPFTVEGYITDRHCWTAVCCNRVNNVGVCANSPIHDQVENSAENSAAGNSICDKISSGTQFIGAEVIVAVLNTHKRHKIRRLKWRLCRRQGSIGET